MGCIQSEPITAQEAKELANTHNEKTMEQEKKTARKLALRIFGVLLREVKKCAKQGEFSCTVISDCYGQKKYSLFSYISDEIQALVNEYNSKNDGFTYSYEIMYHKSSYLGEYGKSFRIYAKW